MKTYKLEVHINGKVKYHHLTVDKIVISEGVYMFYWNQKLKACYPINSTIITEIK
jgi:hypothetical protein